jgi:hypothetical protein
MLRSEIPDLASTTQATWKITVPATVFELTPLELVFVFPHEYPLRASAFMFAVPVMRRRWGTVATTGKPTRDVETINMTALALTKSDSLVRRIALAFSMASEERFEDGVESAFSGMLVSMLQTYGSAAVAALESVIKSEETNAEVAAEALHWLGMISHPDSRRYRLWVLQESLRSASARIRDAASLGLAALDDPAAIPSLLDAVQREQYSELRQNLQLVLDQLEQTRRCRNS